MIIDLTEAIRHNRLSEFSKLLIELAHDDPSFEPKAFTIITEGSAESLIDHTSTDTDDQQALLALLGRLEYAKAQVLDRLFVLNQGE